VKAYPRLTKPRSGSEILFVFLLQLLDGRLKLGGIAIEQFDLGEGNSSLFFLNPRMKRPQTAGIAIGLLRFLCEHKRIKQLRGGRVRRLLQNGGVADDDRRSVGCVNRFDRPSGFLERKDVIFIAVGHDRPLTYHKFFRWLGG